MFLKYFSRQIYFQGLFKTALYIQVLFKPVRANPGTKYTCPYSAHVAQSVTCLAKDESVTANPGVSSSIRARSHTFEEIDHEIISTVILLPSAESFKKGCCQLQAKVCGRSTGKLRAQACQGKSVVR